MEHFQRHISGEKWTGKEEETKLKYDTQNGTLSATYKWREMDRKGRGNKAKI